jgi:hypothetical protein
VNSNSSPSSGGERSEPAWSLERLKETVRPPSCPTHKTDWLFGVPTVWLAHSALTGVEKDHRDCLTVLDDGCWSPKVKALNEVNTEVPEDRQSRFVFDTFGDRLTTESLSKIDDGFYYVPISRVCGKVANEFDVDFEKLDRYSFEISESAKAGAEIIERKATAQSWHNEGLPQPHGEFGSGLTLRRTSTCAPTPRPRRPFRPPISRHA